MRVCGFFRRDKFVRKLCGKSCLCTKKQIFFDMNFDMKNQPHY
nr:MAG TPA: hypothetical protein [Caudoviricetes sp.]